jgi:hypothetical protein
METLFYWLLAGFVLFCFIAGALDLGGSEKSKRERAREERIVADYEERRNRDAEDSAYYAEHNPHDHHA